MAEALANMVAKKLLQMNTFRIQSISPFLWNNGWSSPVYFDDRKLLSYPYARNFIKLELARLVAEMYPDVDVVAGVAVNGIALSTLVAEELGLPLIYVYPTPKDHGLENRIEGELRPHQKVVIIENQLINAATASKVIEVIRENGCVVQGIISTFDFQFPVCARKLRKVGVPSFSLTDFSTLLQVGEQENLLSEEDSRLLQKWHRSPSKYM